MTAAANAGADGDRFGWITRRKAPPRLSRSLIERFERIEDLSSTVSDVLDEFGLVGAVGQSRLRASLPARRIIGPAITVRNVEQNRSAHLNATERDWRMAEILALADSEPGDVLLIQGVHDVSNIGGLISTIAKRQSIAGAVVDGGVRDLGHSRRIDFPVWSRDVSPITGKWRCVTEEINGSVTLSGITAAAGDLVIADETGVCFVPRAQVERVLERCEQIAAHEAEIEHDIGTGAPVTALIERLYGGKAAT